MSGDTKQDYSGLSSTMEQQSKLPLYGATDEQLQSLKDAQQKAVEALEQRYAQPNWFKVAAGFAKPQLGGFLASIGSASDALGDWQEQARAQQLPISQMRAQLAQTNFMMGRNKEVADMLAERRSKGLPLTPEFVSEVTAKYPDSSVAKALAAELQTSQKQQEITSGIQRNALTAMAEARQQGLEVSPSIYKQAGLTAPGQITGEPFGTGQIAPPQGVASPETAPVSAGVATNTLPSGARVNDAQMKLSNLGVPIISGIRTQEEQDALRDHQDASGKWVTKQGFPVADVSKHTSGQAIDVDTKNMTDEHRGMLKALGYKQPDPHGDPNHWELTSSQPTASQASGKGRTMLATGDYHFSPLYTQAQAAESRGLSDKKLDEVAQNRYASLESVANPQTYAESQEAIESMIKTIKDNPKLTQEVVNPLAQKGGVLGGVLNAAQAGMGFSVSGLAGNIHVPVANAIIGSYDQQHRNHFDLLNTQAARVAQMQQRMNNVNPSSIRSGEIDMYNKASVHPETQGANVMLYNLQYSKLNNEMLHEMYSRANNILKHQDPQYALNPNSRTKLMDVMTSPVMSDISEKYQKRFSSLNSTFNGVIGGNQ